MDDNSGNPDLDYDTLMSLPYLEQCIHETLRIHPIAILERKCTKPYQFPGSSFVVPEGMMVTVPSSAVMKDPKNFPNPNTFNPDNFLPENKAGRSPYSFLSFGQGPRNCVGMRFALVQMKVAVTRLVLGFKVVPGEKTPKEIVHDARSLTGQPKGGSWVRLEKR